MLLIPQGWEDDHNEEEQAQPGQAVRKVREGERMLSSVSDLAEVLHRLEITESTWHRWRRTTGQMTNLIDKLNAGPMRCRQVEA